MKRRRATWVIGGMGVTCNKQNKCEEDEIFWYKRKYVMQKISLHDHHHPSHLIHKWWRSPNDNSIFRSKSRMKAEDNMNMNTIHLTSSCLRMSILVSILSCTTLTRVLMKRTSSLSESRRMHGLDHHKRLSPIALHDNSGVRGEKPHDVSFQSHATVWVQDDDGDHELYVTWKMRLRLTK